MKKDNKKNNIGESKAQTAAPTKSKKNNGKFQPAVKNTATDSVLGIVGQTRGRNESKTKREDLLPLD
jgi:hypothetical protein